MEGVEERRRQTVSSSSSSSSSESDSGLWDYVRGKTVVSETTTATSEEYLLLAEECDISREIRKKVEEKKRRFMERQRNPSLRNPPLPSGIAVDQSLGAPGGTGEGGWDVADAFGSLQLRPSASPHHSIPVDESEVELFPDEMVVASEDGAVLRNRESGVIPSQGISSPPQAPLSVSVTSAERVSSSSLLSEGSPGESDLLAAASSPKSGKGQSSSGAQRTPRRRRPSLTVSDRRVVISPPKVKKPEKTPSNPQQGGASAMARPPKGKSSGKTKSSSEPTRYVGNDVFGNYRMMRSKMVKQIIEQERPGMNLDGETIKKMTRNINHFLEDFFVYHCEETPHPYGFIPFKQLLAGLISQGLLPEDADMYYFIKTMKESISKEDFKRATGILFPARNSKRGDTDQYLYE